MLTFPVKDVSVVVENMTPVANDNSTMKDFDAVVVYSSNPATVAEIFSTNNKGFHFEIKGDTCVIYNYIVQNARNAISKAARKYEALDMADNRENMENQSRDKKKLNAWLLSPRTLQTQLRSCRLRRHSTFPRASTTAKYKPLSFQ